MTAPVVIGRSRPGPRRWLRGALAVAVLLLSAVAALLSAVTGWHPFRTARELGRVVADEWHRGARTMAPPRVYVAYPADTEENTDDQHRS